MIISTEEVLQLGENLPGQAVVCHGCNNATGNFGCKFAVQFTFYRDHTREDRDELLEELKQKAEIMPLGCPIRHGAERK